MKRELLNNYCNKPEFDRMNELHGTTHYSINITLSPRTSQWNVTGIPFEDWKERQNAEMKRMGY